jgi:hypothetical protein
MIVAELRKEKKNASFLSFSVEGLKAAAEAVKDIAPSILVTAGNIAAFIANTVHL